MRAPAASTPYVADEAPTSVDERVPGPLHERSQIDPHSVQIHLDRRDLRDFGRHAHVASWIDRASSYNQNAHATDSRLGLHRSLSSVVG